MMSESKLLEGDKDEWFYHSLERYKNLYMFELEFPVDAIEVINETSFCLSGIQNFSKKCEIIQLAIPPKLLPKDVEEGLCKDRDFTIISGGYASSRILHINSIPSFDGVVATTQLGINGITLFQLGDDEHALIKEKSCLDLPEDLGAGVIDSKGSRLVATGTRGDSLYEWIFDSSGNSHHKPRTYKLPQNRGCITKVKFWDENSLSFSTEKGAIAIFDTRSVTVTTEVFATKSQNEIPNLQYTHDTLPEKHKIGVVDSCGGYESFDVRFAPTSSTRDMSRAILPGCRSNCLISGKFNLQYDPHAGTHHFQNFIVTGMKEDIVEGSLSISRRELTEPATAGVFWPKTIWTMSRKHWFSLFEY